MPVAKEGTLPISTNCPTQEVKEGAESAEGREDSHNAHDLMELQGSLGNIVFHWAVLYTAKHSVEGEREADRPLADLTGF